MSVRPFIFAFCIMILLGCHQPKNQYQGYIEGENIYLTSPFAGALVQMIVHRGDQVKKGDLLFVLDPNPQQFDVNQEKALLSQAQATLADLKKSKRPPEIDAVKAQIEQTNAQMSLAAIRVKRNQILYDKHVMDKDTLDAATERLHEVTALKAQLEANLALAELAARPDVIRAQAFQLDALTAILHKMQWQQNQKSIYAPADGIIFDTYYRENEYVSAERAVAALLTHENTRIEFFVPLQQLADLHIGKSVAFSYETSTAMNKATITYISPEAEYMPPLVYSRDNSEKIVFRVKASVEHGERLIPGEPVMVTIESNHG